jgi:hypothetical protein
MNKKRLNCILKTRKKYNNFVNIFIWKKKTRKFPKSAEISTNFFFQDWPEMGWTWAKFKKKAIRRPPECKPKWSWPYVKILKIRPGGLRRSLTLRQGLSWVDFKDVCDFYFQRMGCERIQCIKSKILVLKSDKTLRVTIGNIWRTFFLFCWFSKLCWKSFPRKPSKICWKFKSV